jgi:hypothetical protein
VTALPDPWVEPLWLQSEAAAYLRVSETYVRKSSLRKIFLPSLRTGGRPMLRYDPADVRAFGRERERKLRRVS